MITSTSTCALAPDAAVELSTRNNEWYRFYLPEIRRLLSDAGFDLVVALHRLVEDRPYGDDGNGLFVYARKSDQLE